MTETIRHRDERWLREQYIIEDQTVPEMAESIGVSVAVVCKWMDRYGIERGRGPTPDNTDYRDANWLEFMYWEKEKGVQEIADYCDVTKSTISRWLDKHEIETRSHGYAPGDPNPMQKEEVIENHAICGTSGEDHPFYKGEPHGWRKRQPWIGVRKDAIERDREACVLCGMTRDEHFEEHGQDLDVHHIVPTSEGGRKYDPDNLATLCRRCHSDTHVDRNSTHDPTDAPAWPTPETAQYGGA